MSTHHRPSRVRRRVAAILAVTMGLGLVGAGAWADKLEQLESQTRELQAQREANKDKQEQLSSELEGTDASLQAVYLEITQLDGEIPIAEAELAQAEEDLASAERHLTSVQDRLAVAQNEATTLREEIAQSEADMVSAEDDIAELARSTYRGNDGLSAIAVVIDASTPKELSERAAAYDVAMRSQTQVLNDLEDTAAQQRNSQARLDAVNERIGELKVEAEDAVVAADEARQVAQDRRDDLTAMRAERASRAAELEDYKSTIESQQQQIAADDAELQAQITDLFNQQADERERQRAEAEAAAKKKAEEDAKKNAGSGGGSGGGGGGTTPAPTAAPAPAPPSTSGPGLSPPVAAPFHVTSPFGMRTYPITGGYYMHNGTDIRSACGNAQYASGSGKVIGVRAAAGNGTHGNQVLIDHGVINGDSYVTVYNHLSRFNVSLSQSIAKGAVLGYTGMTGAVTGCHVHVEVWKNGTAINPESLPGWTRSNG